MTKMSSFKRLAAMLLVVMTVLTLVPVTPAYAASEFDGGLGYAWSNYPVYDSPSFSNQIGTIYEREGYTILNKYWGYQYVEYSSPSGAKRGYIRLDPSWDQMAIFNSCVAKMTGNMTVYYGPDASKYGVAGTVYAGELVAVIGRNDYPLGNGYTGGWIYIEYNTTSGRKRGYMIDVNNEKYERPGRFPDFYFFGLAGHNSWISGKKNVYAGPGEGYAVIGSVKDENVTAFQCLNIEGRNYTYIEYNTATTRKSGFIQGDYLP